ncbi:hypothetical protein [Agrobacterium sp. CNPSo 2736]|uniref:hypothetical protein n=1 Tax=Agrobacterium sp. CNPSo 2736 TaxID=2499627 RepID=UPI001FE1A8BB|nr:hypothetical protein [Agrobacterium sp. CNPSo 2736]
MLKASNAAVVSHADLHDFNRVIDEHILPEVFVSRDKVVDSWPGPAPRSLYWSALLREDWTVHYEFLTIDLMPFMRRASERLNDLAAAREVLISSPSVLAGRPSFEAPRIRPTMLRRQ